MDDLLGSSPAAVPLPDGVGSAPAPDLMPVDAPGAHTLVDGALGGVLSAGVPASRTTPVEAAVVLLRCCELAAAHDGPFRADLATFGGHGTIHPDAVRAIVAPLAATLHDVGIATPLLWLEDNGDGRTVLACTIAPNDADLGAALLADRFLSTLIWFDLGGEFEDGLPSRPHPTEGWVSVALPDPGDHDRASETDTGHDLARWLTSTLPPDRTVVLPPRYALTLDHLRLAQALTAARWNDQVQVRCCNDGDGTWCEVSLPDVPEDAELVGPPGTWRIETDPDTLRRAREHRSLDERFAVALPTSVTEYFEKQMRQAAELQPDGVTAVPDVEIAELSVVDDAEGPVDGFVVDVRLGLSIHRIRAETDFDGELTGVLDDPARASAELAITEEGLNAWAHAVWWTAHDAVFLAGIANESLPSELSDLVRSWGRKP